VPAKSIRKRSFTKGSGSSGGGALLGYARVSKRDEQSNTLQTKALRAAGCKRLFEFPAGRPLPSTMSFPSMASAVLWAGPTSSRDAVSSGYPSLAAPAGDHSGGCGWTSQVPTRSLCT
jgi:hypothetical protein